MFVAIAGIAQPGAGNRVTRATPERRESTSGLSAQRSRNQISLMREDVVPAPVDQKALRRRAGKYPLRLRRPRGTVEFPSGSESLQNNTIEQSQSLRSMVEFCDVAARNPRKDCCNRPGLQPLDCGRWCGGGRFVGRCPTPPVWPPPQSLAERVPCNPHTRSLRPIGRRRYTRRTATSRQTL